ncbi:contact-dependent growth inhibition system immunity protein [Moellerella wisconsensis]|uniref:Contact-dependent growth inhibition system immunity protein n=1 Tax=Moellerella wisconsensis TaxID=158849 RepID=A0ACD3Y593_9GAMM|nr:contact-dependent growth inhibition system immunity protein [Moellerella wisconsensis]UNH38258.1 contact-dependent growth inhibition system immunity protein [Moellerella wisconsensis]
MIDNFGQGLNAAIYATEKFYCIETLSGYRLLISDNLVASIYFTKQVADAEFGHVIRHALSLSRLVDPKDPDFFHRDKVAVRYKIWIAEAMDMWGYKNRKALFKKMHFCTINLLNNEIKVTPCSHEKLEAWGGQGMKEEDDIILPSSVSDEALGAAVKKAFLRCRNYV